MFGHMLFQHNKSKYMMMKEHDETVLCVYITIQAFYGPEALGGGGMVDVSINFSFEIRLSYIWQIK
jgi:hypothetical protein